MELYDEVAEGYDDHFNRPVDRWEDRRLTRMLRPHIDGRRVLDLGCGTGWVLDHMRPDLDGYLGVDASTGMLERLCDKHPDATVIRRRIGSRLWDVFHEKMVNASATFDTAVSTWAAHDLPPAAILLRYMTPLLPMGGHVILHGQGPRYDTRDHYVMGDLDGDGRFRYFTVDRLQRAARALPYRLLWVRGTGALADRYTTWPAGHLMWDLALCAPPERHYAFAACWQKVTL